MFTRGILKPDQVSSKEEPISDDDGRKLLGKDLYELINQVPKIQDVHQPEKNERKLGEKSSTGQERSETDETLERLTKKFKEEQVNNKYQLIREYLYSSFERCSFTLLDCPLIDIAEDSFDNLMRIWFVHTSNSMKSENEEKLNEELLSILSSTTKSFYKEDDYIKKLERFLLDNKDNQDLKTVLNLRRGESGWLCCIASYDGLKIKKIENISSLLFWYL